MRTTLDVDDDILQAVKELAASSGATAGKVLSDLARKGLARQAGPVSERNGVPLLPTRAGTDPRVTMKRVNELRDER